MASEPNRELPRHAPVVVDDACDDLLRAIEPPSAAVVDLAALVIRRLTSTMAATIVVSVSFLRSVVTSEVVSTSTVDVANAAVRTGDVDAADLPCWWHSLGFAVSASARRAHNLNR